MQLRLARALALLSLVVAGLGVSAGSAFAGPTTVGLGTADNFAVLGGTGLSGLSNTGTSVIAGDVGSFPNAAQPGFGSCPAAGCVVLTGTNHAGDTVTQNAKNDLVTAYDDAAGRSGGTTVSAPLGIGTTLVPGVYTAAAAMQVNGDLTLDAGGDPSAVFIFQAGSSLITAAGTTLGIPNTRVLLANGAQACNVFWQVGSSATIETASQFVGTILALSDITVKTGAKLEAGRVLARNGMVTLDTNTITKPACATPTGDSTTPTPAATTPTPTGTPVAATPFAPKAVRRTPGVSRLRGPSGTVGGPFTVTVTGSAVERVVYRIDGRVVATVRAKTGRTKFTLKVDPRRFSRRLHRITARVTHTPASGMTTTTHRRTFRPRVRLPRGPRFTG